MPSWVIILSSSMSSPWLLLILKHLLPYLIRFTIPHSSSYLTNMYLLLYFPLNRFLRLSSIPVEALFHLCYFSCKCRTGHKVHSPFFNNHICEIRGCIFSWPAKQFYQIEQNFAGMIIRKKEIQIYTNEVDPSGEGLCMRVPKRGKWVNLE